MSTVFGRRMEGGPSPITIVTAKVDVDPLLVEKQLDDVFVAPLDSTVPVYANICSSRDEQSSNVVITTVYRELQRGPRDIRPEVDINAIAVDNGFYDVLVLQFDSDI